MVIASGRDEHALRNLMYTSLEEGKGAFAIHTSRGMGRNPHWRNEMLAVLPVGREARSLPTEAMLWYSSIGPAASDAAGAIERARANGVTGCPL